MIRVTIRRQDSNQDEVHEFTLPQISVGRVDRNHVVLPNNRVSSVHARVIENDEGIVLVDNNSTNGTFVNGEMVRGPVVLAPEDAVDIGVFTLHFERAEEGHEVREIHEGGPDFEEPPYPGEFDEFQPGPEPILGGEPPDLLLGSAEPTPSDPLVAHDIERAVEPIGPAGSGAFRISSTASDLSGTYGADPRRTAIAPRHTEPDPEPPRTLEDALALAFRLTLEAMHGAPPGPQARVRALATARDVAERALQIVDARQRRQWVDWLAQEVAGTGPLDDILVDEAVSEVLVVGANYIEVRRGEQRVRHPARFSCEQAVHLALERLIGARVSADAPIVDGVTAAGVAVHAVGRPIAASGLILALSRPAGETWSLAQLGERKTLSPDAAEFLATALQRGLNLLVCTEGRADAGLLLGALAGELELEARVVAVHRGPLAPALESRAIVLDAARDSALAVRSAERMRPDWLFVQELGGAEVTEVCEIARRGDGATVAALVAGGIEAGLERLQATLALTAVSGEPSRLRAYVAGCFDVAIAVRRSLSGRDIVTQVAEVRRGGEVVELFTRAEDEAALQATGVTPSLV